MNQDKQKIGQKIKHVVFDIGGVFLDWRLEVLLSHYLSEGEILELRNRLDIAHLPDLVDMGKSREDICREMGFSERDRGLFMTLLNNWEKGLVGRIEGTVSLFKRLKEKTSYRLFCITNWAMETFIPTRKAMPFLNLFEDIVISGQEGIIKPDPRLYRILLERNHLLAEDCVFIDDKPVNVEGAEAVGMKGICFQSPDQLEEDLRIFGVDIPA